LRPPLAFVISATLLVAIVAACSTSTGVASASAPTVSGAWVRPAAAGGDSAAYLVITGANGQADALLSATSPDVAIVGLHQTSMDSGGMAGMHPVDRLEVPAGAAVALAPGGYHLMLMGLKKAVAAGDIVELDLVFEHAGKVVVKAEVRQG